MGEPVLASVLPTHGSQLGGTTITLAGQHFGRDTSTGAGAIVGARVDDQPCTECSVVGGNLVCKTPGLALGASDGDEIAVSVTVDMTAQRRLLQTRTPSSRRQRASLYFPCQVTRASRSN